MTQAVSRWQKSAFAIVTLIVVLPWLVGIWAVGITALLFVGLPDDWANALGLFALPVWVALIFLARHLDPERVA